MWVNPSLARFHLLRLFIDFLFRYHSRMCHIHAEFFMPQLHCWTVTSSPGHSVGFLASRSIDNSMAKSIHFSIKSFMRS